MARDTQCNSVANLESQCRVFGPSSDVVRPQLPILRFLTSLACVIVSVVDSATPNANSQVLLVSLLPFRCNTPFPIRVSTSSYSGMITRIRSVRASLVSVAARVRAKLAPTCIGISIVGVARLNLKLFRAVKAVKSDLGFAVHFSRFECIGSLRS